MPMTIAERRNHSKEPGPDLAEARIVPFECKRLNRLDSFDVLYCLTT